MKLKKIISSLLVFIIVMGILPVTTFAFTDCAVTDNVIDITDKAVYERKGLGAAKVTGIKIIGADVVSATEDNTTIEIILDGNTQSDATINVEFIASLDRNLNISGHTASVTLNDGTAFCDMTLKGQYSSMSSLSGTVTYTLHFSLDKVPVTPPTRIVESDSKTTYSGVSIDLNLKDYFENAKEYYLVDGDEKTIIDGRIYTFKSFEGGLHTLVFGASNDCGECLDYVTVTIEVTEIESGAWLGITTSNGSVNYVKFTDVDGNDIDGLTASLEDKNIVVTLPHNFEADGKICATFDLTQNNGLPKLSTSNAFNGSNDTKVYTNTLTNGMCTRTLYLYNAHPKATSNNYTTYTISYAVENETPTLSEPQVEPESVEICAGESYTLDLSPLFTDADGNELSYSVKINGENAVSTDSNFCFVPTLGGVYEFEFFASDFMSTSFDSYKVSLLVTNAVNSYEVSVFVPEDVNPEFYITTGYDENGADILGDALVSVKGEMLDGYTAYTITVPENISLISVRDGNYGGISFAVQKDEQVSLRKVKFDVVDYDNNSAESTNEVSYGENIAVAGNNGWLLVTDREYTFTATPRNVDLLKASENLIVEAGADDFIVHMILGIANPMSITVPTGATAKLYKYNKYYDNIELDAKIVNDNGDDTTTYQFIADTKANGAAYIYRVSIEGKITKSGWLAWNQQNLTVTYTEDDKAPSYRLADYSMTGEANSSIAEDSVLLNINSRNHLNMDVGQSTTLKAYRAWEIIPVSYNNYIITPDFTYTILAGEDVVTLTEKDSPSAGEGDWMTLTTLKEGVAIIEVTYDAIEVSGGSFDGVYGAIDPNRSGLLVVQVGENNDETVDFGINSFTSIGTSGSENIVYNPNKKKAWDSEFDTLYFTGDCGELTFTPTASSEITNVSVSHDKGATWINLACEEGVYNAEIVPGNNIICVKTESGTAYQVVRGDKIAIKFAEVEGKSNDNGIVEAGETIRVYLNGIHNPIPKMAGNYNPGYNGNYDGYNSQHLNYTCNGKPIYGNGAQYNFITTANCIEVVMPDDGKDVTLCDGYIGLGVIGLTEFVNGGDSHRNIPDNGCTTRGSSTTYHTRSILPEITVSVGDTSAPNNAPLVRKDAVNEKEIYNDQNFAINPDTLFVDVDGDAMTFTVSVNGAEALDAPIDYKFTPNGTGTYMLLFTATDGKETVQHTITLTVTKRPSQSGGTTETEDKFGLSSSEIAGYVTISFTDNGVRVKGESGLKYPKALGTIIKATKVPYKKGEKITHVTKRLLDYLGMRMNYTGTLENGFYLGAICNFELKGTPYDSMGEFDAGVGSGWMITLNKDFIKYGASDFEVKNGDVIKWQYTCQLGKDIGDPFYSATTSVTTNKNNKTEAEEETKQEITDESKEEITKNIFSEKTFNDIQEDDWYYESVKYVYENNLMQGMGNGFEPESKMTRAMLVTVLHRIANPENKNNTHSFKDVPADQWYANAVAWASSNDVVSGVSDTEFAPDNELTREQMAVIIYRFAKMQGYDIDTKADISVFVDACDVSDWAMEAMCWANEEELLNGTSETTLSPKDSATRAQVATILMRFYEKIQRNEAQK